MNATLEVQSCIKKFPWLIQMVKSRLFHEFCDQHISKQRCYFCCDCMTPLFCKAFKCSNKTAVRTQTISKYMDLSSIHIYSVNSYSIVFINQRRENDNHRSKNNVLHKCKVCGWPFDAASSALFCSVECKLRNPIFGSQLDEVVKSSDDIVEPIVRPKESSEDVFEPIVKIKKSSEDVVEPTLKRNESSEDVVEPVVKRNESSDDVVRPIVKRKHRRKGISFRSPFS
ncbi:Uncharacterized protein Rs2_05227 [Raphanus sativus]|nr:Uncharacterized protein Rs2_05227 [Raphanus sativus]